MVTKETNKENNEEAARQFGRLFNPLTHQAASAVRNRSLRNIIFLFLGAAKHILVVWHLMAARRDLDAFSSGPLLLFIFRSIAGFKTLTKI